MDERRAVRDAYDELVTHFGRVAAESGEAVTPEPVERFCAELDAGDRLLGAGCGGGDTAVSAADESAVGLDFSRAQLARA